MSSVYGIIILQIVYYVNLLYNNSARSTSLKRIIDRTHKIIIAMAIVSMANIWLLYTIRYPRPDRAARNSPIITPTRQRPMATFMLLIIVPIEAGSISFLRICMRLLPNAFISFSFSGSVSMKLVYTLMIVPNMATDTAVTIIALGLFPSHTISMGASADFGRLFNIIKKGSTSWERNGESHRTSAIPTPAAIIMPKLKNVSPRVTNVCFNRIPSRIDVWKHKIILDGELNINASIILSLAHNSHKPRKAMTMTKRMNS